MTNKRNYEVTLYTWSSMYQCIEDAREANDVESFETIPCDNYRDAVKVAKRMSLLIGTGDPEIADVSIDCFFMTDDNSYDIQWYEYYVNGKKYLRVEA